MKSADLLIEIGTEELPTQTVEPISCHFAESLVASFEKNQITHHGFEVFSTPRRFAVLFKNVATQIPAKAIEHRGPPASANPKAVQGFAEKFQVSVEALSVLTTEKGDYYIFNQTLAPQATENLLLALIEHGLQSLPIKKPMSWGAHTFKFVRPVHWAVVLFGDTVLAGKLFDQTIGRDTFGHRFLHPAAITLNKPQDYKDTLLKGFVIPGFDDRKQEIRKQITAIGAQKNLAPVMDEDLLTEVASIVEWPVALIGEFSPEFLQLPPEVISLTLKQNQKCFVLKNNAGELQPYFITIANIKSSDPSQVIRGNEKVVRARLSDAAFFFAQDKKKTLEDRLNLLSTIIYQQGLGTLLDKSERIASIAKQMAKSLNLDEAMLGHAALLSKTDLTTQMVNEFPELQGIMGAHYAHHEKQKKDVISAIHEHYQPQNANDTVPQTLYGSVLSISDKLDTIIGIFSVGKKPTGDKDPFALRRAAIGILRIIIEKKLLLDLKDYVNDEVLDFILDRLDAWLKEQGFQSELFASVRAISCAKPYDVYLRAQALQKFLTVPEATTLASAHKRVNNLLSKQQDTQIPAYQSKLAQDPEEKELAQAINDQYHQIAALCKDQDYARALVLLAQLKPKLDLFFDKVLVMCEDETIKLNRLALLKRLSDLFLQIADFSYLPVNHETTHHS